LIGTIFGQFTQANNYGKAGFQAHSKHFNPADLQVDLSGKVFLITGANSGLGKEACRALAKLKGEVHMLCRNKEKGEEARQELIADTNSENIFLHQIDVSSMESVRAFANSFLSTEKPIHCLVHNAGILANARNETPEGNESTFATHVLGPFLLTGLLRPRLIASRTRVIWVTSAGMYTQKLDLDDLQSQKGKFDGTRSYAQMKRAQVILTEMWSEKLTGTGVTVNSMHPGWSKTPGLNSLFEEKPVYRKFENSFREADEGADTIVWLCAKENLEETAKLWFDREIQKTKIRFSGTDSSHSARETLWQRCCQLSGYSDS